MKQFSQLFRIIAVASVMNSVLIPSLSAQLLQYPKTKKIDHKDTYHGEVVADPYRWLEDDRSAETEAWVREQNTVTFSYLDKIPFRGAMKSRMTKLWNFAKQSPQYREAGMTFFSKNNGLQNQSVLMVQMPGKSEAEVLLDPNALSKDGTVALSGTSVSPDGKYFAYGVSAAGSDWVEWNVMEISTRKKLADKIRWCKFSGAEWHTRNGKMGFYYSRYDAPTDESKAYSSKNEFHKVYFHVLGQDQAQDELIYADSQNAQHYHTVTVSSDERFIFLTKAAGTKGNSLWYIDTKSGKKEFTPLITELADDCDVVDSDGDEIIIFTDRNAPRKRLVAINPSKPEEKNWRAILPERQDVLDKVALVNRSNVVAVYLKDASHRIEIYDLKGKKINDVQLPVLGTVEELVAKRKESSFQFTLTSFTYPSSVFSYSLTEAKTSLIFQPKVDFNPNDYETKQVFFTSKDGARVPMFITMKKGTKLDGTNPTLLYGYGGFNINVLPKFSVQNLVWLEQGGIYAVPNLRGGNEYGEEWHQQGIKLRKQNVFNDFISAAEYLIAQKYTSSKHLAIYGRSNGGLLVGACMTQRPDLYAVALPGVGVLDMLRFHKFTIGWGWISDYGSSDNPEEYKALKAYSPLHNVRPVAYPATLVTTGDHDDRVVPAHSFKFAATLQAMGKGENPLLIRIDVNAGHGAGKPTEKQIAEWTDMISFAMWGTKLQPKY